MYHNDHDNHDDNDDASNRESITEGSTDPTLESDELLPPKTLHSRASPIPDPRAEDGEQCRTGDRGAAAPHVRAQYLRIHGSRERC